MRKPVTVDSTEPVLQALNVTIAMLASRLINNITSPQAIKKENVSALAVVEDGKLVGNFR